MDIRKIKKLIEMLEESQLNEIEITEGEESIRLSRSGPVAQMLAPPPMMPAMAPAYTADPAGSPPAASAPTGEPASDSGSSVCSPMVGTFYASPNPDSSSYVELGSHVTAGDTLCMIEAMKIFNQVEAEVSGIVRKILKSSGDPVEFGEVLFVIEEQGV
ncbi:acetyl-CoA carboxylase biotin carboxyl carrier protein [Arenicellales bacterium nBUS_48]